jgi:MFS family permease
MFIASMLLFSVFCLGAGFSQSGMTLDILCGVLGIWSASAVPPAQGMLGTIYERPSQRKNYAFGAFSAGNPMGFVFGTILAGLFTQTFSWRASFFLLAIVYFCTTVVAYFMVPRDTAAKQSLNDETLKRLDLPGTAMTIIGTGMFCAALRYGKCQSYDHTANDAKSCKRCATGLEDAICACIADYRSSAHSSLCDVGDQVPVRHDRYGNMERS